MSIVSLACTQDTEDIYTDSDNNLALVYDYQCALQSLRQMLKTWFGEYEFDKTAGVNYPRVFGANPNMAQFYIELDAVKILDQASGQINQWSINWNQCLLQKVNGNQIYANDDYASYNTKITNIQFINDAGGKLFVKIGVLFGSGFETEIAINVDQLLKNSVKSKKAIDFRAAKSYIPYQPFIEVMIQFPPDFIITAGKLSVIYKAGGFYSHKSAIMCNDYYENRPLKLYLDGHTNPQPFEEPFIVIAPIELNVFVVNE